MNAIYVIIHMVALVYSKRTCIGNSVAEALIHGPILIKLFIYYIPFAAEFFSRTKSLYISHKL